LRIVGDVDEDFDAVPRKRLQAAGELRRGDALGAVAALRNCAGAARRGGGSTSSQPTSCQRQVPVADPSSAGPSTSAEPVIGSKKKSQPMRIADAPIEYAWPSTLDGGSSSPSTSGFHARAMPAFSAPMRSRSSPR